MFRRFAAGIVGAAAVAVSLVVLRSEKQVEDTPARAVPAGESVPAEIQPDRLRELGY